MRVLVWDDHEEELPEIVIVSLEKLEDLLLYIEEGLFEQPSQLFVFPPNAADHLPLLIIYLSNRLGLEDLDCNIDIAHAMGFWRLWCDLLRTPMSSGECRKAYSKIISDRPSLVSNDSALLLANQFVIQIRYRLLTSSLFTSSDPKTWQREWWRYQNPIGSVSLTTLDRAKEKLAHAGRWEPELRKYVDEISSFLVDSTTGVSGKRWLAVSALCFAQAQYRHSIGDFDGALLSNHRALDFYLQSHCLEFGCLVLAGNIRLQFTGSDRELDVGVSNSLNVLQKYGYLVLAAESRNHVDLVNTLRNKSILTHAFMSSEEALSKVLLDKSYDFCRSNDSENQQWRYYFRLLWSARPLSVDSIFELQPDLPTYLLRYSFGSGGLETIC